MNSTAPRPSETELRARLLAAVLPEPGSAARAGVVAARIVQADPEAAEELLELLEAPLSRSTRIHAALLAERFPSAPKGRTTTVEGEVR